MAENCAVCISALGVEVYVPCSNNHKFHATCLLEWATTLHNCPICREDFNKIRVLNDGKEVKIVKPPKLIREKREQLDTVIMDVPYDTMCCELCRQATDEAHMLVCDACDLGFHMYCLVPPLRTVPRGLWECDGCRPTSSFSTADVASTSARANHRVHRASNNDRALEDFVVDDADAFLGQSLDDDDEEEYEDDDEDQHQEEGEITDSSDGEASTQKLDDDDDIYATEDEDVLHHDDDPSRPSTSHQPTVTMKEMRDKKKRKKSKKGKRKSSKSKKNSTSDGSPKKKRKSRRKHKRHRHADNGDVDESKSAHRRIANICGIDLKHSDRYKVVQRVKRSSNTTSAAGGCSFSAASMVPVGRLDLVGREWIPPPDDSPAVVGPNSTSDQPPPLGRSAPLLASSSFTGSLSLLDEILANQSKVLAPGKLLKVNRDGTLEETDELRVYLEKKRRKIDDTKDPPKKEAKIPKPTESDRLFDELIKTDTNNSRDASESRRRRASGNSKLDQSPRVVGMRSMKSEEKHMDFRFMAPIPPPSSSSLDRKPSLPPRHRTLLATESRAAAISSVPTTDPKSRKPMLVVKPEVESGRGDRVKFSGDSSGRMESIEEGVGGAGTSASISSTSSHHHNNHNQHHQSRQPAKRERNRPSRWQPATVTPTHINNNNVTDHALSFNCALMGGGATSDGAVDSKFPLIQNFEELTASQIIVNNGQQRSVIHDSSQFLPPPPPHQIPSANHLKGADIGGPNNNNATFGQIFPQLPNSTNFNLAGVANNAFEFFMQQQQQPSSSSTPSLSQPPPSTSSSTSGALTLNVPDNSQLPTHNNSQIPPFGNLQTDPNMTNAIQRLLAGNPLVQNFMSSASLIPPTSNASVSTANAIPMAAALAALNKGTSLPNPMNFVVNPGGINFLELLNSPSGNNGGGNAFAAPNLPNFMNLPLLNRPNFTLTTSSASNSSMNGGGGGIMALNSTGLQGLPQLPPGFNGNLEVLTQFLNQQQPTPQSMNVGGGFPAGMMKNPFFCGAPGQPPPSSSELGQQHQQNFQPFLSTAKPPPPIPPNLPPMSASLAQAIQNATAVAATEREQQQQQLQHFSSVIPPPPPFGAPPHSPSHSHQQQTSGVRCGLDSPMDIEDENDDQPSSSNKNSARDERKQASPSSTTITKKDRSETIKLADAAMKSALKPYFTKRMISKEEYKEIMKKGVAKLREKNALKPEKVDRFVKQYVELIAKRRQK